MTHYPWLTVFLALTLTTVTGQTNRILSPREAAAMGLETCTVLEVSFTLEGFDTLHLPGAIGVSTAQFLVDSPHAYELPSGAVLDSFFSAIGLPNEGPILLYGFASPVGHLYMALEAVGHADRVFYLNGGLQAWSAEGLPLERGASLPRPSTRFQSRPGTLHLLTTDQVWTLLQDSTITLLDVRSDAEWAGTVPKAEADLPRQGHLPGAIYFPFYRFFAAGEQIYAGATRTVTPAAALQDALRASGAPPDRPVVLYCKVGGRAGFGYALLRLQGHTNAYIYDGSMDAWAADPSLPLVTEN